jgi:hypothetical protein
LIRDAYQVDINGSFPPDAAAIVARLATGLPPDGLEDQPKGVQDVVRGARQAMDDLTDEPSKEQLQSIRVLEAQVVYLEAKIGSEVGKLQSQINQLVNVHGT